MLDYQLKTQYYAMHSTKVFTSFSMSHNKKHATKSVFTLR
ncbi:hypothetical protein GCM10025886_03940 [Tetragenococcus halophilus subsp. flandriensis]|nr:hypothetical protein GCM10025886_03940 [Tetragenococcus halophilus subsp. flandriensis]